MLEVLFAPRGVEYDRRWMFVCGRFVANAGVIVADLVQVLLGYEFADLFRSGGQTLKLVQLDAGFEGMLKFGNPNKLLT